MNFVTVKLIGGLGNQMFQYAAARSLANKNNAILCIDSSWFSVNNDRKLGINNYKLHGARRLIFLPDFLARIIYVSFRGLAVLGWTGLYEEKVFSYNDDFSRLNGLKYISGYFQSEKYFSDIAEDIRSEFVLKAQMSQSEVDVANNMKATDSICLHIRRGDYVSNPTSSAFHGACDIFYYMNAIDLAVEGLSRPKIFIFTDDELWVRSNFNCDHPWTIVSLNGPDEGYRDINLMKFCKRFVISNSSFSWWAAWLSGDSSVVYYPTPWFEDSSINTSDLVLSNWIPLDKKGCIRS